MGSPDGAPGGCSTTARWTGEHIRFLDRHVARLERDAATLGFGAVVGDEVRERLVAAARQAFGREAGIVRLAVSADAAGGITFESATRPLGDDPDTWHAVIAPFPHEGDSAPGGAKLVNRPLYQRAFAFAEAAGAQEALLFDSEDRLVEGSRAALVCVGADGEATTPPAERGAVASIAVAVLEAAGAIVRRDAPRAALHGLRELVAVNAVRGARPILSVDGTAIGDGSPGLVAARLAATLESEV